MRRRHAPRSERDPVGRVLTRAAMVLAAVVACLYLAITAQNGLPWQSHYDLTVEFADAKGLSTHSDVWIAGQRVGQVLEGGAENGKARLRLQLDADRGPLPADTSARIRQRSLLGARVIELIPGRSTRLLADGARIPSSRTRTNPELQDVVDTLDPERRRALGTFLREFGTGFLSRGRELNDAIGVAAPMLRGANSVAEAVLRRDGAAARFFPSLERAAAAADPVRHAIAGGFDPEARAIAALSAEREALDELLRTAPGALVGIRAGLARADPLLDEVTRFARTTERTLRPAPRALQAAASLVADAEPALRDLGPVLAQAGNAVDPVLGLTDRLRPHIPQIRRGLRLPVPSFDELAAHKCDLVYWGRSWRSMLGFAPRGLPEGPIGSLNFLRVSFESVLGSQPLLGESPRTHLVSAYPEPCVAAEEHAP